MLRLSKVVQWWHNVTQTDKEEFLREIGADENDEGTWELRVRGYEPEPISFRLNGMLLGFADGERVLNYHEVLDLAFKGQQTCRERITIQPRNGLNSELLAGSSVTVQDGMIITAIDLEG